MQNITTYAEAFLHSVAPRFLGILFAFRRIYHGGDGAFRENFKLAATFSCS
jgi:hypothetical protein